MAASVLIVTNSRLRAGAEEYLLMLAGACVRRGWEVHTAFPELEKTRSLIDDVREAGARYHVLNVQNDDLTGYNRPDAMRKFTGSLLKATRCFRKLHPDVIIFNLPDTFGLLGSMLAASLQSIPSIAIVHLTATQATIPSWRNRVYSHCLGRGLVFATCSKHSRGNIVRLLPVAEEQCRVINNGVDAEAIEAMIGKKPLDRSRRELLDLLDLSDDAHILLSVGRLDRIKGYYDLLYTIPHLIREYPELHFLWLGDGPEKERLIKQAKKLGVEDKISMPGRVSRQRVFEYMAVSRLLLFPTRMENAPFTLLEAMAAGLPILTTTAAGIPEFVEHGRSALMSEPGDQCSLAANIRLAMTQPDKMREMAERARQDVEKFTTKRMMDGMLAEIESAIKRR